MSVAARNSSSRICSIRKTKLPTKAAAKALFLLATLIGIARYEIMDEYGAGCMPNQKKGSGNLFEIRHSSTVRLLISFW